MASLVLVSERDPFMDQRRAALMELEQIRKNLANVKAGLKEDELKTRSANFGCVFRASVNFQFSRVFFGLLGLYIFSRQKRLFVQNSESFGFFCLK